VSDESPFARGLAASFTAVLEDFARWRVAVLVVDDDGLLEERGEGRPWPSDVFSASARAHVCWMSGES
jgi:hypothetical protein